MGSRVKPQLDALNELDYTAKPSNASAIASATSAMGKLNRQQAGTGGVSNEQASAVTKAATEKAAKSALTAAAQGAQTAGQVNQLNLTQQQQDASTTLSTREQALAKSQFDQQQRLSKLSSDLAKRLHDDTLAFKRDDLGRTVLNEQQMLDYAVIKAKSAEELENFRTLKEQVLSRKQAVMKQVYAVISQKLQQITEQEMQQDSTQFTWEQQQENQKLKEFLAQAKKAAQDKMDKARREGQKDAAWAGIASAVIPVLTAVNPVAGAVAAVGYGAYQASKI